MASRPPVQELLKVTWSRCATYFFSFSREKKFVHILIKFSKT